MHIAADVDPHAARPHRHAHAAAFRGREQHADLHAVRVARPVHHPLDVFPRRARALDHLGGHRQHADAPGAVQLERRQHGAEQPQLARARRSSRLPRDRRGHDAGAHHLRGGRAAPRRSYYAWRKPPVSLISDHVDRDRGLARDLPVALGLRDAQTQHADRGGRWIPHRDVAERMAARVMVERDERAAHLGRRQRIADQRHVGTVNDDRAIEALVE